MPTATENETSESALARHAVPRKDFAAAAPKERQTSADVPRLSSHAAHLADLLAESPVDLSRISEEIRVQPVLADVVQRFAVLLHGASDASVGSVEEAVVLLGVNRLRVLLEAFPAFVKLHGHILASGLVAGKEPEALNDQAAATEVGDRALIAAETPESLYFASFVRLLGLGDPKNNTLPDETQFGASPSEVAEVTEILVRDAPALFPRTNQARREAPRKTVSVIGIVWGQDIFQL